MKRSLATLAEEIIDCRACPRLVAWRERVAREKRRAYRDEEYWGKPVPGFGDPDAKLVIVGLAPGAHGANRTGRMFTGDRSGDFLYSALHRAGLASQATSERRGDGLSLYGVFITTAGRCAPPDNKPSPEELRNCRPWLAREVALLRNARAYLALGKTAYDAIRAVGREIAGAGDAAPPFGHGARAMIGDPRGRVGEMPVIGSYHVSQQNTQTGRLTAKMFDEVLKTAMNLSGLS